MTKKLPISMNWTDAVYSLVIILLYLPLVFLGANVLFPEFDTYPEFECLRPVDPASADTAEFEACQQGHKAQLESYRENKRSYDAWKYFFIVIVNLIALLIALAPFNPSIVYGLFVGSTFASFFSTWIYFDARSLPGFLILVVIFAVTIFFIQRRRTDKPKKRKS